MKGLFKYLNTEGEQLFLNLTVCAFQVLYPLLDGRGETEVYMLFDHVGCFPNAARSIDGVNGWREVIEGEAGLHNEGDCIRNTLQLHAVLGRP